MELLGQVSNPQLMFSFAAVTVVLICAALVFVFGFHSAEQPQFDKLPLIVEDRKSKDKKKKPKDKKSSPNRVANEDTKTKSDNSKKSPAKEKKDDKLKELEKPKPKPEPKVVKKEAPVKSKKSKSATEAEKPADFDEGVWEEVPKKERKEKKAKPTEDGEKANKKDSPIKKSKKTGRGKESEEVAKEESAQDKPKIIVNQGPILDEEAARKLQEQVEEFQRVLKEKERRDKVALGDIVDEAPVEDEDVPEVKDLRTNRLLEIKEKEKKKAEFKPKPETPKKESPEPEQQEASQNAPAFDELGDTWTDTKAPKKGKKKPRKDQ